MQPKLGRLVAVIALGLVTLLVPVVLGIETSMDHDATALSGAGLSAVTQVIGGAAGNAGDGDATTYCFASDNAVTQLVMASGQPITTGGVASQYGQPNGLTVYDGGIDVAAANYAGYAGPLVPVGMSLSDAGGWPHIAIPQGEVGIDPQRGRFAFYEGGTPSLVGDWDTDDNACDGVFIQGNRAYLSDWSRGLDIVDISDPANPVFLGNDPCISTGAMDVVVDGTVAYVTMKWHGLRVFDVSNPASPNELVGIEENPSVQLTLHLTKVGNTVYVATENEGLILYNVSTPSNPSKISACPVYAHAVCVENNMAYIASGNSGLVLYDLSNPSSPAARGQLAKLGYTFDVKVAGQYAYVAEGTAGLRVVNVSNPNSPSHVTTIATASEAYGLGLANGCLYVAERGTPGHVEVFDLADPASPVLLATYQSPKQVNGLHVIGSRVYAAGHSEGLLVINPNLSEAPRGPVTSDYYWDNDADTPTPTASPTLTRTPTPTLTPDPSQTATLTVAVILQGRRTAPSDTLRVPLHVELLQPGGAAIHHAFDVTCDEYGRATMAGIAQGTYDVWVRGGATLYNVRRAVVVGPGAHMLDMGELVEGDGDLDGRISILDFSRLASGYGVSAGETEYNEAADFNRDGIINILDFTLLASNYGLQGPIEITN